MKEIEELIDLAKLKNDIDLKRGDERFFDEEWLMEQLISEVHEVEEEMKLKNTPFLEDELGDILWSWIILVKKLEDKGFINSCQSVIKRTLKKYKERVNSIDGSIDDYKKWEEIKIKQKNELWRELNNLL